ncbi:MAG: chromate transporter [Bacteroidales bacterium]|nr:chromate transporter [Bacteroidales bacterium]
MIYLELFCTFLVIGLFTFGGGYSMVALIQDAVVQRHGWMSAQEFTDMLALSQMTPGPIGINTATYAGYTAVAATGAGEAASVAGALVASVAVVLLPVALLLAVCRWMERHRENPRLATALRLLRLTVVGLVAAAALSLLTAESFGLPGWNRQFVYSVAIFAAVFVAAWRYRVSPALLIVLAGAAGWIVYG